MRLKEKQAENGNVSADRKCVARRDNRAVCFKRSNGKDGCSLKSGNYGPLKRNLFGVENAHFLAHSEQGLACANHLLAGR